MNSLSNKDLIEIAKKYNIQLRDVLNKDKFTSDLPFGFYIINLQNSNEGEGTHWCALYYNIVSIWFDPFGFAPPREIINNIDNYIYNNKQIQNIKQSSCGYYCLAFIKILQNCFNKYKGLEEFKKIWSKNTNNNELILDSILYY